MKKVIALSAVLTLGLLGAACPGEPAANNTNAPANANKSNATPAATTPASTPAAVNTGGGNTGGNTGGNRIDL